MFGRHLSLILGLILTVLSSTIAHAEPSYVRFDANVCHRPQDANAWGITEEQLKVLCDADRFTVTLLRRGDQFVVLVGEVHVIDKQGTEQAKNIIQQFKFRAIEGLSAAVMKATDPIDDELTKSMNNDIEAEFKRRGLTDESLLFQLKKDGLYLISEEIPAINGKKVGKDFGQAVVAMNTSNPVAAWAYLPYFKRRVYKNFREGLPEMGLTINMEPQYKRLLERTNSDCMKDRDCWNNLLVQYRNSLMVESLQEILITLPEEGTMLAAVGMAHVPGMVRSLVCQYGFEHHTFSRRGRFKHNQLSDSVIKKLFNVSLDSTNESFEFKPENCQND